MSAPNFHYENSRRVFAVELQDEWDYDDSVGNIQCTLKTKGYSDEDYSPDDELRSYPARVISSKSVYKNFGRAEVGIKIEAIVRSGYYSGCNFDWCIKYYLGGNGFEDSIPEITEIASDLNYYHDMNKGMAAIQCHNVLKFFENTPEQLIEELEQVYSDYTTPLRHVATFSNGEAIYEQADTLKSIVSA